MSHSIRFRWIQNELLFTYAFHNEYKIREEYIKNEQEKNTYLLNVSVSGFIHADKIRVV